MDRYSPHYPVEVTVDKRVTITIIMSSINHR